MSDTRDPRWTVDVEEIAVHALVGRVPAGATRPYATAVLAALADAGALRDPAWRSGQDIPDDVLTVWDAEGDEWTRRSAADLWMCSALARGGTTPELLADWGPVTSTPPTEVPLLPPSRRALRARIQYLSTRVQELEALTWPPEVPS